MAALLGGAASGYALAVATVQRIIQTTPDRVWSVLSDGWTYSDWVVGTVHIRDVAADWPAVGSKLHHKAGPWPLSLQDSSTVLACVPGRELTMQAGLWPLGSARVTFELEPYGAGATRVTMHEDFDTGPLRLARNKINDLLLNRRNLESLRRLTDIAVREKAQR